MPQMFMLNSSQGLSSGMAGLYQRGHFSASGHISGFHHHHHGYYRSGQNGRIPQLRLLRTVHYRSHILSDSGLWDTLCFPKGGIPPVLTSSQSVVEYTGIYQFVT